MVFKIDLGNFL